MTKFNLVESAKFGEARSDGAIKVVLISPGQGSSAYYQEDMLREFGPAAFPKGTHSYPKHEKPQDRNPFNMIGGFIEETTYEDGVGLVNWLLPRDSMRKPIEEIKDYVGFSISASGDLEEMDVDGQVTKVATSIIPSVTNTVDLVSYAGRGGHFAMAESVLEEALANSQSDPPAVEPKKGNENMPTLEEKVESLISTVESLVAEFKTVTESLKAKDALVVESTDDAAKAVDAAKEVAAADIPESVKESLLEGIKTGNYEVKPAIDAAVALVTEIRESVKEELKPQLVESYLGTTKKVDAEAEILVEGWN